MELRERGDSGTLLMRGKIGIRRQASCFSGMNDFNASLLFNITQIGFCIISGKSPPLQLLYYSIWISFGKVTKATYQRAVVVVVFFFCVIAFRRSANYDENSKSLRKRLMKIIMKKKNFVVPCVRSFLLFAYTIVSPKKYETWTKRPNDFLGTLK